MVLAEADGRLAEGGDAGRMSTKLSGISPTLSPSRAYRWRNTCIIGGYSGGEIEHTYIQHLSTRDSREGAGIKNPTF